MKRPNFIYFITDQQRSDYLGCAGHPVLRTPNIDRIAENGTRFERFYVANPVCMPNRATLMTGRMSSINGVRYNGVPLPVEANTFVDVLRDAGYDTAMFGKSHLQTITNNKPRGGENPAGNGPLSDAWRRDNSRFGAEEPDFWKGDAMPDFPSPYYGFDHVDLVVGHGDRMGGHIEREQRAKLGDLTKYRGEAAQLPHDYTVPQGIRTAVPEELYSTFYVRDRAIEWLRGQEGSDQPFFAFVSFPDPHHPFTPPGKYWDMYDPDDMVLPDNYGVTPNAPPHVAWMEERRRSGGKQQVIPQSAFLASERHVREAMALTCGMITMIDDAVGAIMEELKRIGRADDTVIVYNSDHGDFMGDHGLLLKGPIHYQSVIQVPFIWSDPQNKTVPVTSELGSTVDMARTILSRAGLTPYNGMQGEDLAPAFAGEKMARKAVLVEDTVLIDQTVMTNYLSFETQTPMRTLVTERFRLTKYLNADWGELYDLDKDPGERVNLWDDPASRDERDRLVLALVDQMIAAADQSPWPRRNA